MSTTHVSPHEATRGVPRNRWAGGPRWARIVVTVGAVLAVLLLGASAGLVVARASAEPVPGAVDIGFAQDMSVHHRQAVLMAELARDSTDPQIRGLAIDIQTTQLQQIGQMQGWLALWDAPALPPGEKMTWMSGMGSGVTTMPGMASPAEIERLRQATGPRLDVLFLQLMLRHHQGGAAMARYAAEQAQLPEVRNLAQQMLIAQTQESRYMRRLLAERGAQPLPFP